MITSNYVRLVGNLGADPEMRFTASGTPVTSMRIAVNEYWVDKSTGEKKESTLWVKCSAFGPLAENLTNKLSKGERVMVEGKMKAPSAWINRTDGKPTASPEVLVNAFMAIPRGEKQEAAKDPWEDEDIPF